MTNTRHDDRFDRFHRVTGLAVAGCLAFALATSARAASPWVLLEELRNGLQKAGPTTGRFVQTYIPAGFSTGDEESGHLSIWLPDCLRWNYQKPSGKNFLVCQGEVYFWNEDEPGGRHYRIDPTEEAGLDLLLVAVSTLRERYVASSEELADGTHQISLVLPASEHESFSAKIRVDPAKQRVIGLEYTDAEGNLTRFRIFDYQPLRHTALFQPPHIEWTEE
ncbi:MAG: outer membrane lipoprotein carrier protein LolA [bacterium]|nr:outer membrane lipoprotein carrier protein LolA [bacterium]